MENPFEEIKPCLSGITKKMMNALEEEEVMGLGGQDPRKRTLLKLYYRGLLTDPGNDDELPGSGADQESKDPYGNKKSLAFTDGQLISSKFSGMGLRTNRTPLDLYIAHLGSNERYHKVDFSNNLLLDDDLPHILTFVKTNQVDVLILSGNRIACASPEAIKQMFDIVENVRLVVVYGNTMATLDGRAFFSGISQEAIQKIIWIPSFYVDGDAWQAVIPNQGPSFYNMVKNVHKAYYMSLK